MRFAAHTTEDGYELLAEMLGPLSSGAFEELPRPYADRIHGLRAEMKRDESLKFDGTTSPFLSCSVEEARNFHGTAIAAMQHYDENLVKKKIST